MRNLRIHLTMVYLNLLRKCSSITKKLAKCQLKKQAVSYTITDNFPVFFGILKQLFQSKNENSGWYLNLYQNLHVNIFDDLTEFNQSVPRTGIPRDTAHKNFTVRLT